MSRLPEFIKQFTETRAVNVNQLSKLLTAELQAHPEPSERQIAHNTLLYLMSGETQRPTTILPRLVWLAENAESELVREFADGFVKAALADMARPGDDPGDVVENENDESVSS